MSGQGRIRPGQIFANRRSAGVAAASVGAIAAVAWPYTVDDAFIVGRYARHIAAGQGHVMNPGQPPSDAITGPFSLLPGVLAAALGVDPVLAAKLAGAVCGAIASALFVAWVARRARGACAAWIAAALLAVSPSIGTWSAAGLETGIAALAFALACRGTFARPHTRASVAGVSIAALAWLRPELLPASSVLLVGMWLRDRRAALRAAAWVTAGTLAVVAYRVLVFGAPLPLAVLAKPASLSNGLAYVGTGLVLATSGFGVLACGYGAMRGRRDDRVLGAALLVHVVAVVLAGGDWMPGMRLLVPVLPAYAALVALGIARLGERRLAWAVLAMVLVSAVPALDLVTRAPELRAAGDARETAGAALATWLRRHARRVALVDVGYLAYASGVEVIDLGGLTDPEVARATGGHVGKRIDEAWLAARAPDAIVVHTTAPPSVDERGVLHTAPGYPVERHVAAMTFVRERYRVAKVVAYAPHYHYVVLQVRRNGLTEASGT